MKELAKIVVLDCTLRDGGYYNGWDFPSKLINRYLAAMKAARVDVVELGFRFLKNEDFKGACAFTTDDFLRQLDIPSDLSIGVMVNGGDLYCDVGWQAAMESLFPEPSSNTPVDLVRLACHYHELANALAAANWLANRGYRVGINLMQIGERTQSEVENFGALASDSPIEVLYFADSMGSLAPDDTARIIRWLRTHWSGQLGIHAHDNMRMALANTLRAQTEGVSWLDATLTGMGRGPGNARTEELLFEVEALSRRPTNVVPLMSLIRDYFGPMKRKHKWGTNAYYYLGGKYGIHPTYIQEMLSDARYAEEDILAVIERLREEGGKKFSVHTLEGAKRFYHGKSRGTWAPAIIMKNREVLILGTGPSVTAHRAAIERYIRRSKPLVLALNAQESVDQNLIDLRLACHPVRLLADVQAHQALPQPLVTPFTMLPDSIKRALENKKTLDFGLSIEPEVFSFHSTHCIIPKALVVGYALACAASGAAKRILLAGFDGYDAGDSRNYEMSDILHRFYEASDKEVLSVTPSVYRVKQKSIYAI